MDPSKQDPSIQLERFSMIHAKQLGGRLDHLFVAG
jgi:hypothetical protein